MAAVRGIRTMTRYRVGPEQRHETALLNKRCVLEERGSFKPGIAPRAGYTELSPL